MDQKVIDAWKHVSEDQKVIDAWKHVSEQLDQIWPYKRISAPLHLIEKYNNTIGKETGMEIKRFAINVVKEADVSEDLIWEAMTMKVGVEPTVFNDSNRFGDPPVVQKSEE
jgi:hypothetical protein